MIWLWLRQHPAAFAAAGASLTFVAGVRMFGDVRAGLACAAYGALLTYLAWRPNGFGWRIDEAEALRIVDGRPAVRSSWLLRAAAWVVGIAAATFGILALVS